MSYYPESDSHVTNKVKVVSQPVTELPEDVLYGPVLVETSRTAIRPKLDELGF